MSSAEFAEWVAYERLHPDPAEWTMQLTALLITMLKNGSLERDEAPYAVSDFLPGGDRQARLSQGMALIAQYAAHHAKRQN